MKIKLGKSLSSAAINSYLRQSVQDFFVSSIERYNPVLISIWYVRNSIDKIVWLEVRAIIKDCIGRKDF